jgi:hypothetical protein
VKIKLILTTEINSNGKMVDHKYYMFYSEVCTPLIINKALADQLKEKMNLEVIVVDNRIKRKVG